MNLKPLTALNNTLNNRVIVELKGKREFRGVLDGYDLHMNLVLREAQEFANGQAVREIPLTILRGDNVIYISP